MEKPENELLSMSNEAWLVTAILIIISFFVYYIKLYPDFMQKYEENFWSDTSATILQSETNPDLNVNIRLHSPKYVSFFMPIDMSINLENKKNETVNGRLIFNAVGYPINKNNKVATESSKVWLNFIFQNENQLSYQQNYIDFSIPPHTSKNIPLEVKATTKLPPKDYQEIVFEVTAFIQQKSVKKIRSGETRHTGNIYPPIIPINLTFTKSKAPCGKALPTNEGKDNGKPICFTLSSERAFSIFGIKNLLLPPWANGFLTLIVFSIVWAVDRITFNKEYYYGCPCLMQKLYDKFPTIIKFVRALNRTKILRMLGILIYSLCGLVILTNEIRYALLENKSNQNYIQALLIGIIYLYLIPVLFNLFCVLKNQEVLDSLDEFISEVRSHLLNGEYSKALMLVTKYKKWGFIFKQFSNDIQEQYETLKFSDRKDKEKEINKLKYLLDQNIKKFKERKDPNNEYLDTDFLDGLDTDFLDGMESTKRKL